MSYHCSLSAIQAPKSKGRGRQFIPPPRKIVQVPWKSISELQEMHGPFAGEWIMSTNQYGEVKGLPHISGAMVARKGSHRLLWRDNGTFMEIHASNFVGHYEEPEEN